MAAARNIEAVLKGSMPQHLQEPSLDTLGKFRTIFQQVVEERQLSPMTVTATGTSNPPQQDAHQ